MGRAGKSRLRSSGLRAAADDLGRGQKLRAAGSQGAALAGALPENLLKHRRSQAVPWAACPSPAPAVSLMSAFTGGFNRSAQHLLILRGEEVCHGDVADLVHGSAESRAVGAMEEWAKCCGDLAGAGKEEQDGR